MCRRQIGTRRLPNYYGLASMAIVSNDTLLNMVQECNLLTADRLKELLALVERRGGDGSDLPKMFVERGWFSTYQMNLLLAGRGEELIKGPYIVIDRLNNSSRSEVYKARHLAGDYFVALKMIGADKIGTPEAVSQFLQKMAALAELEHPNVVQICDADQAGDSFYCAMEYLEGTDLASEVVREGKLAPALASEYIRQAALGLQCAYEHNLVHRDIKPANLLLVRDDGSRISGAPVDSGAPPLIKILDWGLAALRPPQTSTEHAPPPANEHSLIGTADYLSPDQAMNPESVDIRGDIYSLGCSLYTLLTGQAPFSGSSLMQKALQHMTAEAVAVEKLNPEVPRGLGNIVRRMMAKEPKDRFQTPASAALALRTFCYRDQHASRNPLSLAQLRSTDNRTRLPDDTPLPPTLKMKPEAKHR
jgi:eukaryotic-like serine/threonine-protein kinase